MWMEKLKCKLFAFQFILGSFSSFREQLRSGNYTSWEACALQGSKYITVLRGKQDAGSAESCVDVFSCPA